jgi:hypothetical protein
MQTSIFMMYILICILSFTNLNNNRIIYYAHNIFVKLLRFRG